MTTEQLLFALLRESVCGVPLTETEIAALTPEALEAVFSLADSHDLAHLAGHVLKKHKLLGKDPVSSQFDRQTMGAMYRFMQQREEYGLILKALETAKIPHLPLKGAILRDHYPQPWMRTSCDIDILVRKQDLDTAIDALEARLQYTRGKLEDHCISLFSPGGTHLELHYDTIGEKYEAGNCRDVLARIWEEALPTSPDSVRYTMSDAMFYFYHIAHMAKHFTIGGCGIRPFLDLWILNHSVPHDAVARQALLREGGLDTFCTAMENLTEVWFSGREPDSLSLQAGNFLLSGGTYGTVDNFTAVGCSKAGSAGRYWLRRIFMPYQELSASYPVLLRHKWLMPFCQIVRWLRILLSGGIRRARAELMATPSAEKSVQETGTLLDRLGLS